MLPRITSSVIIAVSCGFGLLPSALQAQSSGEAIVRATAALDAAAPRAQSDPAHPIFHLTAPGQWMNDPNGPIYYHGNYHIFYQLDPFHVDGSGPKYWGHVRSHDLVKWEPLPIALAPSTEMGEAGVWSGCCTINGQDEPMIFYTSVTSEPAQTHAEQWAAIGDQDLITWRKCPENPILTEALHGGKKIYEWRDPFIFHCQNRTFLVAGGNLNKTEGGQAVVNIYEAQNADLKQWTYRGVLFQIPDAAARTVECPNFFNIGDDWVLLFSPYGKVQYYVGSFDVKTCRFQPRSHGLVDCGQNFYAPNTMQLDDGRRIMWGWINGFPNGQAWNGCLTIPRVLGVSRDGQLQQSPAPQLRQLRGSPWTWRNGALAGKGLALHLPHTNTLEIQAEIMPGASDTVTVSLENAVNNASPVQMTWHGSQFNIAGAEGPLDLAGSDGKFNLRILLDRSVLEVFANDTLCATKVIVPFSGDLVLRVNASDGSAVATRVQAWPMKSIW